MSSYISGTRKPCFEVALAGISRLCAHTHARFSYASARTLLIVHALRTYVYTYVSVLIHPLVSPCCARALVYNTL